LRALSIGSSKRSFGMPSSTVVQAEIENGIHHARHRDARSAAHRNEQRIVDRAEALAGALFELVHRALDLLLQSFGERAPGFVETQARIGRDREPRRHRQPGRGHLRQAGALPPEEVAHERGSLAIPKGLSFIEEVDELRSYAYRHGFLL
jgi:hypothetical protein